MGEWVGMELQGRTSVLLVGLIDERAGFRRRRGRQRVAGHGLGEGLQLLTLHT